MHLTPAAVWSLTLACNAACWVLLPQWRLGLGLLLAAHAALLAWGVADLRLRFFGPALCRGGRRSRALCLTFDDGPDPVLTPAVLDALASAGCRATFFVVAQQAARHPELVRRAFAAGHTIGCHDLSHGLGANLRLGRRMHSDIAEAQRVIAAIIGRRPLLYRPPVGLANPHLHPALARLGMRCIGWSRSSRDGGNRRPVALRRIPSLAGSGAVVMLHDVLPRPQHRELFLAGLRGLLQEVRRQGLAAQTVDELFGVAAYG